MRSGASDTSDPGGASEAAAVVIPDAQLVDFLRWALPQLGLRWRGFRKPRRQVKRRIARRLAALGMPDLDAYRALLEALPPPQFAGSRASRSQLSPEKLRRPEKLPLGPAPRCDEWAALDACCRVTISRFYRDRAVWEALRAWLAERARPGAELAAWSAGCASGEEPYTLALLAELELEPRGARLSICASDASTAMLARACDGRYPAASLADLPAPWRERFEPCGDDATPGELWRLPDRLRQRVAFFAADLRQRALAPSARFDVILCRNLAFTYFDLDARRRTRDALRQHLALGALLVLGGHERLPDGERGFERLRAALPIYRVVSSASGAA